MKITPVSFVKEDFQGECYNVVLAGAFILSELIKLNP